MCAVITKERQKNRNLNKIIIARIGDCCNNMPYFRQGKFKIYLYYRWGFTNIDLYWSYILDGGSVLISESFQKAAKKYTAFYIRTNDLLVYCA